MNQKPSNRSRWPVIAVPYLWLLLFFAIPLLIVLKISFAQAEIAIPPYTPLFDWTNGQPSLNLSFDNYQFLVQDKLYIEAWFSSITIAFFSTLMCLLIGYPMAYAISLMKPALRNTLLLLVVLPSWTSFLIRVYAWMGLLKNNGLLNNFLIWLGIIDTPLTILHTPVAVYIGMVYAYLPFMVLPLYANLVKLDKRLREAASDLGARRWKTFLTVTLPLSKTGIVAGCLLVMIPVVGEFVVPELLGGPSTLMIGRVMWQEFFNNHDWPMASAISVAMLLLLLIPIVLFHRAQSREWEAKLI